MKSWKVILLFLLLIGFPVISYVYLKFGYNFRLDALNKLEPKMTVEEFSYPVGSDTLGLEYLRGKVTLAYSSIDYNNMSMLETIFEEYSHRPEFQMIGFENRDTVIENKWMVTQAPYPFENKLALIDTAMQVRNYYAFDTSSFSELGIHIPIVLPRKEEKDIKMKEN